MQDCTFKQVSLEFKKMSFSFFNTLKVQKQQPGGILWKGFSVKFLRKVFSVEFSKIRRKAPTMESCNFTQERTPWQVFSCELCETLQNIVFIDHLQATDCKNL